MTEENKNCEEGKKRNRFLAFFLAILTSPVNSIFGIGLCYYLIKVFIFGDSSADGKIAIFGILGLWLLWFLFKNILKLIFLALILAFCAIGYYHYTHQDQRLCEEQGGVWNKTTEVCEEKLSWWESIKKLCLDKLQVNKTDTRQTDKKSSGDSIVETQKQKIQSQDENQK